VIDDDPLGGGQSLEIETERGYILLEILGPLLERHEDARLAVVDRASDEKFYREERFSTAWPTADEGRAPSRQATSGELVEAAYARRALGQGAPNGTPAAFRRW